MNYMLLRITKTTQGLVALSAVHRAPIGERRQAVRQHARLQFLRRDEMQPGMTWEDDEGCIQACLENGL